MSKRHNDALFINAGACNPSGIAHSIVDACREIRDDPGYAGTDQIRTDPAVRLMVHQLAFICGVISGVEDFAIGQSYSDATTACLASLNLPPKRHTVSGSDAAEDDDLTTENTHA